MLELDGGIFQAKHFEFEITFLFFSFFLGKEDILYDTGQYNEWNGELHFFLLTDMHNENGFPIRFYSR